MGPKGGLTMLLVSSGGPLGPGASSSSWRMKGVRDSIKNTSAPRVCGGGGEYTFINFLHLG